MAAGANPCQRKGVAKIGGLAQLIELVAAARRFAIALGVGVVVVIVWLATRRAGRKGLEAAIPMWAAAAILVFLAAFGPFAPLTDIIMILATAALIVVSVVALVMLGLAPQRKKLARHRTPPWEGKGW